MVWNGKCVTDVADVLPDDVPPYSISSSALVRSMEEYGLPRNI